MADTKISQLTAATQLDKANEFAINQQASGAPPKLLLGVG